MNFSSIFKIAAVKPRDGYFFDHSALKYRKANPEEHVRAGIVKALQTIYGYLPIQISTEAPLWWKERYQYRADIILWKDTDCSQPFALIETKSPGTGLTSDMLEKLDSYAKCLKPRPKLLVLTNGHETTIIRTSDKCELPRFPTLAQSIKGFQGIPPLPEPTSYQRPSKTPFELGPQEARNRLRSFPQFSIKDSLVSLDAKRAYLGFYEMLLDESVNIATQKPKWNGYKLVEDRRVRWSEFGNASGGRFHGKFRHFVLETPRGRRRDVCFSISTYAKYPGAAMSSLAIIGGIDGKQALQLQSDIKSCSFLTDKALLYHRGYISLGEGGRIATNEVLSAIKSHAPELLDGDRIVAAKLDATSLRGAAAQHAILRLAVLSDILDTVRTKVRKRRAK